MLWVGMPAIRGTKSTSDMSYLDELYRARAEKAGIIYVDIWDGFVDDQGRYAQQGPDFEGQTRRLRTYDGVYFTKYGAEKLGHYVEHDLRRVLGNHVLPVALPGPEEQSPAKGPPSGARPSARSFLSTRSAAAKAATSWAAQASRRTGSRSARDARAQGGDAIVAPPGRADDFSWPRAHTSGAADVGPSPDATPPKGSAGKNDAYDRKKNETKKPETMKSSDAENHPLPSVVPPPTPRVTTARPRRAGDQLNGAPPRPPLPIGPAASDSR